MYKLLNKECRAPLPAVHKAISRYRRQVDSSMSRFYFERDLIAILHAHNWRKRDYLSELRATQRRCRSLSTVMCEHPFDMPRTVNAPLRRNAMRAKL